MAEDFGVCGRANRPCKIAHSSTYPNRIGVYPSEFLPSNFTIWHAVFATNFSPQNIDAQGLDFNPIGAGLLPGLIRGGTFNLPGPIVHTWQSHHYVIFARTANRFNVAYTITEADISNINELGVAEIDLGEYVFEVVAATDEQIVVDNKLTEEEVAGLENNAECNEACTFESEDDREFRKLFEMPLENAAGQRLANRFQGIVPNVLGIEYRLDNGTDQSKQGLDQAGIGDLDNASYRDGTSRKILVQLISIDADGEIADGSLQAGDVVYLTYIAVKEHYLRQRVNISWQTIDPGTVAQCVSLALGYSIVHYRFYEWDMEPEPGGVPQKLSGWRAVEAFSSDLNFVAPVILNNQNVLADFILGGPDVQSDKRLFYIPGRVSISQLQGYRADRNSMPRYTVSLSERVSQGGAYHLNAGIEGNPVAYQEAEWFQRNEFSKYLGQNAASAHIFYNVHPRALRKRDIDKFGIERHLAVELEKDFSSGKPTFFPFMDDPDVANPTSASNEYLGNSNAIFEPVKPVTSYGGNFEAFCNSLGTFPTNPADGINTYHSFESNRITERFEEDTRVLVEHNFAAGPDATKFGLLSPRLITIEGAGGTRGSVTCLADPSKEFAFAGHTNDDGFLIYNSFSNGHTEEALRSLTFRPDLPAPPFKENTAPTTDQFEELVGFSGMIGDIPGVQPGRAVAITSAAQIDSFTYKTTDKAQLQVTNSYITDEQVEEINLPDPLTSPLIMPASNSYYGSIQIKFSLGSEATTKSSDAILLAKVGSEITGIVDGLTIRTGSSYLQVDFRWLRASSFELIGARVEDMTVTSVTMRALQTDQLNDFLNEQTSHSLDFANSSLTARFTDRSLFFGTDVVSIAEDAFSNLYIFFSDADGGISAASSNDYGDSWVYYYGIVERILPFEATDPFVITSSELDSCYLFFSFGGKVMCKKIPFSLFEYRDANLIERFGADILVPGDPPSQNDSIYSSNGRILRREILSYIAAGDLTDTAFLEVTGKVPDEFSYERFEERLINGKLVNARKSPIAIGPYTAFLNVDVNDLFFSAYRKDNGEMKLWHLATTQSGDVELQCNFSVDDGQNWYDLWEFIEFGYNRLRFDSETNTQFIDRTASGDVASDLAGVNPEESNQAAPFGINVHWSRLKRHKIGEGEKNLNTESQVLEISSPYVFYQPTTDRVFLFYVYEGCLLCKVFNEEIFANASRSDGGGMASVKTAIEQQTRAYFVDGSLASSTLREEIHRFPNDETGEIMAEGNIVFRYPFAVDNFTDDRVISDQRVCAYDLSSGLVRVFYKHSDSINLKSALWTGSEWWAEDFLRDPQNVDPLELPDYSELTEVTGGFGEAAFSP